MNILYISGSPRKSSNTDYLLEYMRHRTQGEMVKLVEYTIAPCRACWACLKTDACVLEDDMEAVLIPKLLAADALVVGSPVFFNNVTAQVKAFIDRTWPLRGALTNKIGAAVVVGRKYGAESAITAMNAFFLKHEMLIANRGVSGLAFRSGEIRHDTEALESAAKLADRLLELGSLLEVKG
ncbi:MAG: flavodoxin family protein [Anaerolineae bacterium]